MPLKLLNRPVRTAAGTINYRFRELLEALDLLGTEERTWIVSGAIVTWPEDLLDEQMEVHDPRVRFSRDGQTFFAPRNCSYRSPTASKVIGPTCTRHQLLSTKSWSTTSRARSTFPSNSISSA